MIHDAPGPARNRAASRDVVGLAEPTQGQAGGDGVAGRLPERPGEVGLHQTRGDRVDPHAGAELQRQDAGEVDDRGLGGVVDADGGVAPQTAD